MAGNQPISRPISTSATGNLQLGLGNLLLSLGSLPQLQGTTPPKASCRYTYLVRFVNPKKKSEFTLREWHDIEEKFTTIEHIKFKLLDTFPKEFPATNCTSFQIGYLEPPNQAKRWLCEERDLQKMYVIFPSGSRITLWCEIPVEKDGGEEPPSKKKKALTPRDKLDEELQDVLTKLKEKHPDMEVPKLRLWAKLIQSGHHADYNTPPNIPLITGKVNKPKKTATEGVADVVAQAATAIVKACKPAPSSPNKVSNCSDIKSISPLKLVSLRRSCLEDLKKTKELFEDEVLSKEEFEEEKKRILEMLRGLGK